MDPQMIEEYRAFLQSAANRYCVGALRYGDRPKAKERYLRRLQMEIVAYRRAGNFEQLLNIVNYAFLESVAPQNVKLHFDPCAASATRDQLGV